MTAKQGEPRKVRWTVPAVDTSVIAWLDAQENISQSVRLLIRESIQRDGFIDVVYKPVEQLPRGGRLPLAEPDEQPGGTGVSSPAPRSEDPASTPSDGAEEASRPAPQVSIDEIMASTRR